MNSVLAHDSALLRLYWARDNLGELVLLDDYYDNVFSVSGSSITPTFQLS